MITRDAIAAIVPHLGEAVCVHANGFISRAAYGVRDHERCFYMIGSMGLASSIGLGVALARPAERVVVFDGDGNVLMNLGTLATIGAAAPRNLLHLCFDNGVHASTGGQRTISDRIDLGATARAAGYRFVERVDPLAALEAVTPAVARREGPGFLHLRVTPGPAGAPGPRIPHTPQEMAARLRSALGAAPQGR